MICGLSTGWKWSEWSLCSAGLVRRIWLSLRDERSDGVWRRSGPSGGSGTSRC